MSTFKTAFRVEDEDHMLVRYFDNETIALVGYITRDQEATRESPRLEWDNFGTMICWSRRYCLGDRHRFPDSKAFLLHIAKNNDPEFESSCAGDLQGGTTDTTEEDVKSYLLSALDTYTYWLPVYFYDHSVFAVSTVPFADKWDSGQCGYIYVTKVQAATEYLHDNSSAGADADKEAELRQWALSILKAEVQTYNAYLIGDMWGVCFETFYDAKRPEDTGSTWVPFHSENRLSIADQVWGYYGEKEALESMISEFTAYEKAVRDILEQQQQQP